MSEQVVNVKEDCGVVELNPSDVRKRLVHNNRLYIISLGKQVSIIIGEGIVQEESLCFEDRNALIMYRNSKQLDQDIIAIKEEEPYCRANNDIHRVYEHKHYPLKRERLECERCTKTFNCYFNLKRHMREVHAKQRIHRCKTCFKAYSRRWTKTQHEKDCIQYV